MRKTNFFLHFSKTRGLFFRKIFSVFMQLPKGYSTYLKFEINLLSCTQTGVTSFLFFFSETLTLSSKQLARILIIAV